MADLNARNWRELIRPKTIKIEEDSHTKYYGKFVCEPLERGFGITIGNSLRRILLSSLQGAAIVSATFENVVEEIEKRVRLDCLVHDTTQLKDPRSPGFAGSYRHPAQMCDDSTTDGPDETGF